MRKISKINDLAKKKSEPRLLGIFAHPDDESLRIAGILFRAHQEGMQTFLVCLTKGEKGSTERKISEQRLAIIRKKELAKAGVLLGVRNIYNLDFSDGSLITNQKKVKSKLRELIRKIEPSIIVTHDPTGMSGHPDHITTSKIIYELTNEEKTNGWNLYFVVYGKEERETVRNLKTNKNLLNNMPLATDFLELDRKLINVKINTCRLHRSQKIESSKSIGLEKWYTIFNTECLHKVNRKNKYIFQFGEFHSLFFNFKPI